MTAPGGFCILSRADQLLGRTISKLVLQRMWRFAGTRKNAKCQNDLKRGAKFCDGCGTKVE
jgi:hypothetical protein